MELEADADIYQADLGDHIYKGYCLNHKLNLDLNHDLSIINAPLRTHGDYKVHRYVVAWTCEIRKYEFPANWLLDTAFPY
jgi:hypothetical protein